MPAFTLWSKNRLLGRARIMYFPPFPGQRCGDFEPTEIGEHLMPILLGADPALAAFYDFALAAREEADAKGVDWDGEEWPEFIRNSTEYADMISTRDELRSLELELRDSGGRVVPTDWIQMKDAEQMSAMAREIMLEEAASMGLDLDLDMDEPEPWEPKPAKYQIQVMLEGGDRLRSRAAARRGKRRKRKRGES